MEVVYIVKSNGPWRTPYKEVKKERIERMNERMNYFIIPFNRESIIVPAVKDRIPL